VLEFGEELLDRVQVGGHPIESDSGASWPKTEWLVSAQDIRKLPFNRARAPILKLKSAGLGALVAQVFVPTDNALQP